MNHIFDFFLEPYQGTATQYIILEAIAFVFGIASVWYIQQDWLQPQLRYFCCTGLDIWAIW